MLQKIDTLKVNQGNTGHTLSFYIRQFIRDERKRQGLSFEDLAAKIHVDKRALERVERGETKLYIDLLEKIVRNGLGKTVQEFIPHAEMIHCATQKRETPQCVNTVISVADALQFFRSIYQDAISHRDATIATMQEELRAQNHLINCLTGELEEMRSRHKVLFSRSA